MDQTNKNNYSFFSLKKLIDNNNLFDKYGIQLEHAI